MSELFGLPLLLGLVAFLIGWLAAKFAAYVGARAAGLQAPETDRTIRALEANLRVAKKDAEEATEQLSTSTLELDTLRSSVNDLEQTMQFRDEEMETMRQAVKHESAKVVELRRTLTERAEETIRANVHARDSETELSVLKAGASVMCDEVDRLEGDRKELTDRLKALGQEDSQNQSEESSSDDAQADQSMSDC